MTLPPLLDHIVIAGPDLAAAVDEVERLTGVRASPGGSHPIGTANHLIALTIDGERGTQYIEIIGPDPARTGTELPSKFGIDRLTGIELVAYAIHPVDIEAAAAQAAAAGVDPGPVVPLSRRTPAGDLLAWRLTHSLVPSVSPLLPFLIDWGQTAHPGLSDLPALELVAFTATDPHPDSARRAVNAFGSPLDIARGDAPRLVVTVRGPRGEVTL
ncbi:VOC family protein [Planctomonas psychrotolerans]|uniref:VOC family protein n=1 Tax=Planctomonas psychrotolerans TaxID=2528712 RepID=UPI0012396161|nr:VOC family protein [Planctomonas psychrotolerans]